ncbi:20642_t:CDS:2 [Gigaspora margarita]|uniref:20642_t:CDS:1 n=1 Tax=Gigaspora margarita TaxID=4874 RepID=A0ABM8W3Y0_GIGMA|nr:20642_t:CDS:2 [Gigaspora margarita]
MPKDKAKLNAEEKATLRYGMSRNSLALRKDKVVLAQIGNEKEDYEVQVWRETNDGLYWTRKTLKPDKGEFGIVGVQVARNILHLNVLIMDEADIHRPLSSVEIPVQFANADIARQLLVTKLPKVSQ